MNNLSAEDVVTIAIKMEDNGEMLYRRLAKKYSGRDIGEMFNQLAEQELMHKSYFEGLLSTVKTSPKEIWFKPDLFEFLKVFAGDFVFFPNNMLSLGATEFNSLAEALTFAMSTEKDAVLFYGELKNISSEDQKAAIEKVIEQEKAHFILLANEKNNLVKS